MSTKQEMARQTVTRLRGVAGWSAVHTSKTDNLQCYESPRFKRGEGLYKVAVIRSATARVMDGESFMRIEFSGPQGRFELLQYPGQEMYSEMEDLFFYIRDKVEASKMEGLHQMLNIVDKILDVGEA